MLRAFQWDLARQVERLDWLLRQLPRYAEWGYNELYLHLEDAIEYPSLPGVARRDAYSQRQFAKLVDAAQRVGIGVVPIVNLLGHTQYLIKVPELRELNEVRAADGSPLERGQICPVHPRTLAVAEKLLRDVAPFCTAGKVHVGLDESFALGRHPLSRREIARVGRAAHFARYVGRLRELTRSLQLSMGMWADMLYFLPAAIPLLPRDVAVYEWYYYGFRHRPRVELFNFAEVNVGERLRHLGHEYWGCPMNGAFRYEPVPHFGDRLENIRSWWRRCRQLDAAGFLVTSWEPNRLALPLTTVIDAAAASLWLEGTALSPAQMLERGFARVMGRRPIGPRKAGRNKRGAAKAAARAALATDAFPFAGYPRWEINTRWDVVSRREPLGAYRKEARHFAALMGEPGWHDLPEALRASIAFRWYLAARDLFVREAQQSRLTHAPARSGADALTAAARAYATALRIGENAASTSWRLTRDRLSRGPNETMVAQDRRRFEAWRRGEPVFGPGWQLCYRVTNFAPAVQLVVVEQQDGAGNWGVVQSCHTIEFQTRAARPRNGLVRHHAAPITWPADQPLRIRIALRGIGAVEVSDVTLTNGRVDLALRQRKARLGRPAPRQGWLEIDWARNVAVLRLPLLRQQKGP